MKSVSSSPSHVVGPLRIKLRWRRDECPVKAAPRGGCRLGDDFPEQLKAERRGGCRLGDDFPEQLKAEMGEGAVVLEMTFPSNSKPRGEGAVVLEMTFPSNSKPRWESVVAFEKLPPASRELAGPASAVRGACSIRDAYGTETSGEGRMFV
jgi:hypothetical protein